MGEIGFYHVHIEPYSNLFQFARVSKYFWAAVEQLGSNAVEELIRFLKSFFEKHIKCSLCFVTNIEIKGKKVFAFQKNVVG